VDSRVVGSTGAVWIDGEGDGVRTPAVEYARRIVEAAGTDLARLMKALSDHDEAVAAQAAGLLAKRGISPDDPAVLGRAREAGAHVERGFRAFATARAARRR
jgi:hypothetical protein